MADFFEEFSRRVSDVASDITKKMKEILQISVVWYMRSSRVGRYLTWIT